MVKTWTSRMTVSPREDIASMKDGTNGMYVGLRDSDIEILHIISLTISSISFAATCLSGYWLVRMRRSFRHDLIVLLIVSDFMKSLWFVLYNIIVIGNHSRLDSEGAFCQACGYFFAMGIEAADSAVFLIALHSTVYIFWPNRAGGESGLYPYRRWAYGFFGLWPNLMASLAFVRGAPAYVNTGQSCYLPVTPWWSRSTLSWIPRYFVLLIILIMYGASYTYVRVMMRRYSRRSSELPMGQPDRLVPLTPPLHYHGLLPEDPEPPDASIKQSSVRTRQSSARQSSTRVPSGGPLRQSISPPLRAEEPPGHWDSIKLKFDRLHPGTRMKGTWAWAGFESQTSLHDRENMMSPAVSPLGTRTPGTSAPTPAPPAADQEPAWDDAQSPDNSGNSLRHPKLAFLKHSKVPTPTPAGTPRSNSTTTLQRGRSSPDFYRRTVSSSNTDKTEEEDGVHNGLRLDSTSIPKIQGPDGPIAATAMIPSSHLFAGSQVHIVTMLRQGPLRLPGSTSLHSGDESPVLALDQATFESGGISRTRDRIRRQLRLLFIYPAVYACVWIFPFASDITKFKTPVNQHDPLWMLVLSLVSLTVQGLCDTVVFCSRERPWKHMRDGFWKSFAMDFLKGWKFSGRKDSGRTREERFNEGARARSRRDEEMDRETEFSKSPGGRMPATGGAVDWWDVEEGGSRGHDKSKSRAEKGK
ncbi:G protein-coupled receptor gpr1 [Gnomoniopsis smithogilvyi]|uniref:G protein-coupled receptor gpr1 n=1 Tax=Gnomoniopsis smithogilvyi TaxID=1191159 RepID=A0A9W9CT69_9PEZI|nr:G protein-coupled receptor gpr1 [Gnomoniopsis smithogilvyi]